MTRVPERSGRPSACHALIVDVLACDASPGTQCDACASLPAMPEDSSLTAPGLGTRQARMRKARSPLSDVSDEESVPDLLDAAGPQAHFPHSTSPPPSSIVPSLRGVYIDPFPLCMEYLHALVASLPSVAAAAAVATAVATLPSTATDTTSPSTAALANVATPVVVAPPEAPGVAEARALNLAAIWAPSLLQPPPGMRPRLMWVPVENHDAAEPSGEGDEDNLQQMRAALLSLLRQPSASVLWAFSSSMGV